MLRTDSNRARRAPKKLRRQQQVFPLTQSLRPEIKYVDAQVSNSFDYNGLATALSNTSTGDGVSGRTGRSLRPVKLDINARITVGATSPVTCRFLIVRYLANQAGFSIADILSIVGSGYATQCPYNIDWIGQANYDRRAEIIYDTTFTVSTSYIPVYEIKRSFRMKGPHAMLRYNSADAEPIYGGLLMIAICTLAGPAGLPALTATSRLHFLDA